MGVECGQLPPLSFLKLINIKGLLTFCVIGKFIIFLFLPLLTFDHNFLIEFLKNIEAKLSFGFFRNKQSKGLHDVLLLHGTCLSPFVYFFPLSFRFLLSFAYSSSTSHYCPLTFLLKDKRKLYIIISQTQVHLQPIPFTLSWMNPYIFFP